MQNYAVEVSWSMGGTIYVEAENPEHAREIALETKLPDNGEYLDSSFQTFDIYLVNSDGSQKPAIQPKPWENLQTHLDPLVNSQE
jgi:hypothetical protein